MEQLRQKYEGRDVEFVTMYVREPHPHERGFKDVPQPTTYEQKVDHAKQLIDVKDVVMPVVVDEIEPAALKVAPGCCVSMPAPSAVATPVLQDGPPALPARM